MSRFLIVGAGFSGAVLARALAEAGLSSLVVDERSHIAGNCHTERDAETGVMVHRYGPHIFHTGSQEVWDYVHRFGDMMPFVNRVKTTVGGKVYSLPINLHTINQFFGEALSPAEAQAFIAHQAETGIEEPRSFEEQALRFVGEPLYRAFFYGYTRKQWGREPAELPASILKRLPLRFTYDDNYYNHPFQGLPRDGYSAIVAGILAHPQIELRLGVRLEDLSDAERARFEHLFYSGPLDRYFDYALGALGYRTLDFEEIRSREDLQGCPVMNYGDESVPWTRIAQHNGFSPWEAERHQGYIAFRERARACGRDDVPYYPIRLVEEKAMLRAYMERAETVSGVTFLGRLGTYQYLDMDVTIARALETARRFLSRRREGGPIPVFFHAPLSA